MHAAPLRLSPGAAKTWRNSSTHQRGFQDKPRCKCQSLITTNEDLKMLRRDETPRPTNEGLKIFRRDWPPRPTREGRMRSFVTFNRGPLDELCWIMVKHWWASSRWRSNRHRALLNSCEDFCGVFDRVFVCLIRSLNCKTISDIIKILILCKITDLKAVHLNKIQSNIFKQLCENTW